ncbi:helix-turn-helix domain-containing protein [Pantoea stewartii]|uniref:Transcriptional regulator n=1 Tax=Pantoea stewartii subsp. stewartii DC283 TaxID=660596 RepID=A0ABM6KD71_PANSE|nr:helix-turn-helix transcriptional regulator [Pantoea stewartii]ARF52470.1 transcriptional regulator [Pantoea stewartii subsp. stewartii DC283]KAB0545507.1 helix-turn-helix transcriptional regulator [Pantoea stewartii subsp. stewartii]
MAKNSKTLSQIHDEFMRDPAYRVAYEAELEQERLQETLTTWRKNAGLTSAQVAERMGIKPPTVSRMEKNATKMSYETLRRYANACGVHFRLQVI